MLHFYAGGELTIQLNPCLVKSVSQDIRHIPSNMKPLILYTLGHCGNLSPLEQRLCLCFSLRLKGPCFGHYMMPKYMTC